MKKEIAQQILKELEDKRSELITLIHGIEDARNSEEKSSAGDKHETARAMAQNELDKYQNQLSILNKNHNHLKQVDCEKEQHIVAPGTIVKTEGLTYFFAISHGKVTCQGKDVFVISLASPIGQAFVGKKLGDEILFQGKKQKIIALS